MSKEIKLKPCPFCGGSDINTCTTDFGDADGPLYVCVECYDCNASVYAEFEETAVAKWNRRARKEEA